MSEVRLHPSWLERLRGEFDSAYMQALKSWLVAEKAAGRRIFPAGSEWFRALDLTPLGAGPRRHPRPGSLSRAGPGARPVLLGPARRPDPAQPRQHLQGDGGRSRHPAGAARLPRTLGEAGRAAAEQRAHRADGPGRLAPRARLGAVHRRGDRRGQRASRIRSSSCSGAATPRRRRRWSTSIDKGGRHLVLKAPHPSPLSAHSGFFGCRHFSKANEFLESRGLAPIDWALPECAA